MTTELGHLVNDLVNAAHKCGAAEDCTSGEQYESLWSAQVAAEKALLDYLDGRESTFMKPTEEGFGRLVSELIKRTHECALAPDGYGCDAYLVQVAAEKALLEYVERELVWKNEDPRMLREQVRVADVAFNGLQERHNALERELAKLREGVARIADYCSCPDDIEEELRALLK